MRYLWFLAVSTVFLVGCSKSGTESGLQTKSQELASPTIVADAVYTNGKIYTVNEAQPWAEAVAIRDGAFVAVGSNADVAAVTGEGTNIVDLGGRMAMPGLVDVHNHLTGAAMSEANLSIENRTDQAAMLAEIKEYAAANPDLPYVRGEAWNMGVFPDESPRKEWLDEIVPDRPAFFLDQSGHSAWVNSKALELIGVDENTEQTATFVFDVDPATNQPTGTIKEYALGAMEQVLEPIDPDRLAPHLQDTIGTFSMYGWTAIKLAEGEVPWVQAANLLDEQGKLDLRLFPSWFHRSFNTAMTAEESRDLAARWEDFKSDRVYPRYVKMYMDGTPGSYSVLMFDDYEGRPDFKGKTNFPSDEFIDEVAHFNSIGVGVIVHVFGDASSLELVKAFEAVRERNGDNGVPLHFSHSVITQPAEIERLAKISDVCMDFLTTPYPHPAIESGFVPPIGNARYQTFLNTQAAVEAGIPFSFGSDWPSSLETAPNGFFTIQSMVTRRDPNNPDYGVLNPDQAISLEQAVRGITQGGIDCLGFDWPDKLGSIEVGKLADFIVIDQNIFEVPIESVKDTNVDLTVVGGEVVFSRN